jgi:hypothetical protein
MHYNTEKVVSTRPCQFEIFSSILGSCSIRVREHIELQGKLHFQVYLRTSTKVLMMFEALRVTPLIRDIILFGG